MKEILSALVESLGQQSLALQAVADHVSALKATLLRHYPEIEDDLKAEIAAEQKKSQARVLSLHKSLAQLRVAVSQMSN